MSRDVDAVFRWRCPNCGSVVEEGNPGMLEVAKVSHLKKCNGGKNEHNTSTNLPRP